MCEPKYPAPPVTRMVSAMDSCYAERPSTRKKPGSRPVDDLQHVFSSRGLGTFRAFCGLGFFGGFGRFGRLGSLRCLVGLGRFRGLLSLRVFGRSCLAFGGIVFRCSTGFRPIHQLDKRHRGIVTDAKSKLQDAQVTAGTRAITGTELIEELGYDIPVA